MVTHPPPYTQHWMVRLWLARSLIILVPYHYWVCRAGRCIKVLRLEDSPVTRRLSLHRALVYADVVLTRIFTHQKAYSSTRQNEALMSIVALLFPLPLKEVCQGGRESLGDQLVNGLSRMVVVVPHRRCPVRVRGCNVAVEAERGWVVEDLPEVGASVEGLSSDTSVAGLELIQLGGELRVE